jgi:hypothetical protein
MRSEVSLKPVNASTPVALTRRGPLSYKPRNFGLGGLNAAIGAASDFLMPWPVVIGPYAAISGEQTGEADLSTEQAGAQASPRVSCPDGDEGWPQGCQCPPCARSQTPQRLMGRWQPATSHGTLDATGGFSGGSGRRQNPCCGLRVAGPRSRRRGAAPGWLHGVEKGRRSGRTQSRAAAAA